MSESRSGPGGTGRGSGERKTARSDLMIRELSSGPKSKERFAELLSVSTRTVEKIARETPGILYDRKLGSYRFETLFPERFAFGELLAVVSGIPGSRNIQRDLVRSFDDACGAEAAIVSTATLSQQARNLIALRLAIASNCIIRIDYRGRGKPVESKYVRPEALSTREGIYYLHGVYDKRNRKNVGERRNFAVSGILQIESVEYVKNGHFTRTGSWSVYGEKEDLPNSVELRLVGRCAEFFKIEGEFERPEFEFLSEDADGSVLMRMRYRDIEEVVLLVQQWMPLLTIMDENIRETVRKAISVNTRKIMENMP